MIALVPLFVVAIVACVAIVAILAQNDRHANQVSHLLAHAAQQHGTWARERWELNTRIAVPGVAAAIPAPPVPSPEEVLQTIGLLQPSVPSPETEDDPDDVDESHLVGTAPDFVGMSSEIA